ncbi:MAG: tetratricopeptide repeat protein [Alphaproteobacteria bacterium]
MPADVSAQARFERGIELHRAGQPAEALPWFAGAVEAEPRSAVYLNGLGIVLRVLRRLPEAIACYRRAIALEPGFAVGYSNLGNALKDNLNVEEAIAAHRTAVDLAPRVPDFIYNLGIALAFAGRSEEALDCYEEALALNPGHVMLAWDRARMLLQLGDYRRGWRAYEVRWKLPENPPRAFPEPHWNGRPYPDRRLLVHCEQGFGDTIQCARFLPAVKALGGTLVVECQPSLIPLIERLPEVDEVVAKGAPLPPFDRHLSILGLPRVFVESLAAVPASVPYLSPPPDRAAKFDKAMAAAGSRLKVGIVWSGSTTFRLNWARATTIDRFLHHFALPEVLLYSLQKGPPEAELAPFRDDPRLIDLSPLIADFADTAAAVERLDLVLMTDSAVAHLAGALARPVWVLLSFGSHWLWLNERDDSPWYPTMRFFRQRTAGDWDEVFTRAAAALSQRADSPRRD